MKVIPISSGPPQSPSTPAAQYSASSICACSLLRGLGRRMERPGEEKKADSKLKLREAFGGSEGAARAKEAAMGGSKGGGWKGVGSARGAAKGEVSVRIQTNITAERGARELRRAHGVPANHGCSLRVEEEGRLGASTRRLHDGEL